MSRPAKPDKSDKALSRVTGYFRDDMQFVSSLLNRESRTLRNKGSVQEAAVLEAIRVKVEVLCCLSLFECGAFGKDPSDDKSQFEAILAILARNYGATQHRCEVHAQASLDWTLRRGLSLIFNELISLSWCTLPPKDRLSCDLDITITSDNVDALLSLSSLEPSLQDYDDTLLEMLVEQYRCQLSQTKSDNAHCWRVTVPTGDAARDANKSG